MQADAFSGFDGLYTNGHVREAACWAHARRKFYDLFADTRSPHAEAALTRIQALYEIEQEIRGKLPEERRRVRQARAGPLLAELQRWLVDLRGKVSAKSELATAINYALKRWVALTRYCDDGTLEIDTDAIDKGVRRFPPSAQVFASKAVDLSTQRQNVGSRAQPSPARHALCRVWSSNYSRGRVPACYRRGVRHGLPSTRAGGTSIGVAPAASRHSLASW